MTFELTVGSAVVHQVTEVDDWNFGVADLFPAADAEHADAARTRLHRDCVDQASGELRLAIHTYVVRLGDTVVLVDAGNGNAKHRPTLLPHHMFDTDYLERLAAVGVTPGDVDIVVNTHLHPDHCGGNTVWDGQAWTPTFGNAQYLFLADELDALIALAASGPVDGVLADLARTYDDSVRPVLEQARSKIVAPGEVVAEHDGTSLRITTAPGHTSGHVVLELDAPGERAVFSGDVVHHPVQLLYPDLGQGGDADPQEARATRDALLQRCADDGAWLLTAHFPVNVPLRVTIGGDGRPTVASLLAGAGVQ